MPRRRKSKKRARGGSRKRTRSWADLPTEKLLEVRLSDLGVRIEGSLVEDRIVQVLEELERRGILFKPHFWVSDDWFTPKSVPGCAVPFYLLHPRLTRLERSRMLQAEGANRAECLKILRHEVGHAIDHAYRLNLIRKRQRLFGNSSKPYPRAYLPKPMSRDYVQNLDYWYAQAHPDEDFAETFAVWLQPRSKWRKAYAGWPVMRKLRYMDELMGEIAGRRAKVRTRRRVDPLEKIQKTLGRYYAQKQRSYSVDYPDFFDADLRKLFSDAPEYANRETAVSFLRRVRPTIRHMVSRWTGHYEYTLDQVLKEIVGRCRKLRLRVTGSPRQTTLDLAIMLTVNTMNFVYSGRRWLHL